MPLGIKIVPSVIYKDKGKWIKQPKISDYANNAASTQEQIDAFVKRFPYISAWQALLPSSIRVLDFDVRNGGLDTYKQLKDSQLLPDTWEVRTPTGGIHLFYHTSSELSNTDGLLQGMDCKDLIVLAPSSYELGVYEWVKAPDEYSLAELPVFLETLWKSRISKRSSVKLDKAPDVGTYNDTLFSNALVFARQGLQMELAINSLKEWTKGVRGEERDIEVERTVESAYNYANVDATGWGDILESLYTDDGCAAAVLALNKNCVLFVDKTPFVWDGKIWIEDKNTAVIAGLCRNTAKVLTSKILDYVSALKLEDKEASKKVGTLQKYVNKFSNITTRAHIISAMATLSYTTLDKFNTHDNLLNLQNGIINLDTNELIPHNRKYYFSIVTPSSYDPASEAPDILSFIAMGCGELGFGCPNITFGDFLSNIDAYPSTRMMLQVLGYSLSGQNLYKNFFLAYTPKGDAGRSTLLSLMSKLLGEFSATISGELLLDSFDKSSSRFQSQLAKIRFARAILTSELPHGTLNGDFIKMWTGGDTLDFRQLYSRDIEGYTAKGKMILVGNTRPYLPDTPTARRLICIPMDRSIPESFRKNRQEVDDLFASQIDGFLRILIWGYQDLRANGLLLSKKAEDLRTSYIQDTNYLAKFIGKHLIEGEGSKLDLQVIFTAFQNFARLRAFQAASKWSLDTFSTRLNAEISSLYPNSYIHGDIAYNIRIRTQAESEAF